MPLTEHASGNTPLHPQDDSESVDSQEFDMASLFDFESLFEDRSLLISPNVLYYHPYNDLHTLEAGIIGVLRIPGLYEYAIRLEYSDEQ
ncbi:hypothetical protein EDD85DRAFT_962336 [Armillaria nabsnona]|nr:hypothetical protein EDD85DRAFT_962336 [Armillaria nabsnona]